MSVVPAPLALFGLTPGGSLVLESPVAAAQRAIMASGQAVMPEAVHTFGPGVYIRGLPMPAGLGIIGRRHKTAHVLQLLRGTVLIDNGDGPQEFTATDRPVDFQTAPGTKRAVIALTDAYLQTIHLTPTTDLAALEAELLEPEDDLPRLELPR